MNIFIASCMRLKEDSKTVVNIDVLVPKIGELIGGSQREERLEVCAVAAAAAAASAGTSTVTERDG